MKLTQDRPGYYWRTDDPIRLSFNEHGDTEPQIVNAVQIGRDVEHGQYSQTVPVTVSGLNYMGAGLFGESRGQAGQKWTGGSHKFGVYRYDRGFGDDRVVILRTDGSGMKAYIISEFDALDTWTKLCASLTPEVLWNLCNTLTATYRRGCNAEHSRMADLMFAGRLKIRKRRNGPRELIEV